MTRIIAGFAGSLPLRVPRSGTRPTSDRVREAIFSGLDARGLIAGSRVLDLFAGSGALGLEAASRGATTVTLVEKNSSSASIARHNAHTVVSAAARQPPTIAVRAQTAQAFLAAPSDGFDLVFVDPPYSYDTDDLERDLHALVAHLSRASLVVVERSARSPEPRWPHAVVRERVKKYGDTAIFTASLDSTNL